MESSSPRENRVLAVMLMACGLLLGLIFWRAGAALADFPRLEPDWTGEAAWDDR